MKRNVIVIPGLFSEMPGVREPSFLVVPLTDYEKKQIAPWGKQVRAPNVRTAILRARVEILDQWIREHSVQVDGWYVATWKDEGGWSNPQFFKKDMK